MPKSNNEMKTTHKEGENAQQNNFLKEVRCTMYTRVAPYRCAYNSDDMVKVNSRQQVYHYYTNCRSATKNVAEWHVTREAHDFSNTIK